MQDSVKKYIKKIEDFLKTKNKDIELILVGGLAMSFYGAPRFTVDIDAEIKCEENLYFLLLEYLKKEKIAFNIGENINNWGILPLPKGYRDRTKTVYKSRYLKLKILDPVDFIYSKLLRGTEEDFNDMLKIIKKYNIGRKQLEERKKLISFPKDPETLFFRKKFTHLMGQLPQE